MADSTLIKLKSLQEFEEVAIQKLPERGLGFAASRTSHLEINALGEKCKRLSTGCLS